MNTSGHQVCECWHSVHVPEPPGAPLNLAASQIERDQLTLTWQPPDSDGGAEISSYVVEMKGEKDTDYYILGKADPMRPKFTALGLKPGEKYNFRVKAKNSAGFGEMGAELDEPVATKAPISAYLCKLCLLLSDNTCFNPPYEIRSLQIMQALQE